MSIAVLLKRALPGAKASINGHIDRGERIAAAIQERFQTLGNRNTTGSDNADRNYPRVSGYRQIKRSRSL